MAHSVPLFCGAVDDAMHCVRHGAQNSVTGCRVITRFVPLFLETGCKAGALF
jgi:hypothetical protein